MKSFLAYILCLVVTVPLAFAQAPSKFAHVGTSMVSYKGDLSGHDKYTVAFHGGIQFYKKKRLNGSFNLGFGNITSENREFSSPSPDKEPNRYFKTNFLFLNYDLHINLIKRDHYSIYISQGIGFIRFTPTDQFGENLQDQLVTRADDETYRNASFMLPTKIGAMYLLPNYFGVGFEAGFYGTMTDYLDNISELGESGNDNILSFRFNFYIPLFKEDNNSQSN